MDELEEKIAEQHENLASELLHEVKAVIKLQWQLTYIIYINGASLILWLLTAERAMETPIMSAETMQEEFLMAKVAARKRKKSSKKKSKGTRIKQK